MGILSAGHGVESDVLPLSLVDEGGFLCDVFYLIGLEFGLLSCGEAFGHWSRMVRFVVAVSWRWIRIESFVAEEPLSTIRGALRM